MAFISEGFPAQWGPPPGDLHRSKTIHRKAGSAQRERGGLDPRWSAVRESVWSLPGGVGGVGMNLPQKHALQPRAWGQTGHAPLTMYHMLDQSGSMKSRAWGSLRACLFTLRLTSCCWSHLTCQGEMQLQFILVYFI